MTFNTTFAHSNTESLSQKQGEDPWTTTASWLPVIYYGGGAVLVVTILIVCLRRYRWKKLKLLEKLTVHPVTPKKKMEVISSATESHFTLSQNETRSIEDTKTPISVVVPPASPTEMSQESCRETVANDKTRKTVRFAQDVDEAPKKGRPSAMRIHPFLNGNEKRSNARFEPHHIRGIPEGTTVDEKNLTNQELQAGEDQQRQQDMIDESYKDTEFSAMFGSYGYLQSSKLVLDKEIRNRAETEDNENEENENEENEHDSGSNGNRTPSPAPVNVNASHLTLTSCLTTESTRRIRMRPSAIPTTYSTNGDRDFSQIYGTYHRNVTVL